MKTLFMTFLLVLSFSSLANDMNAYEKSLEKCTTDLVIYKLGNIETITSNPANAETEIRQRANEMAEVIEGYVGEMKKSLKFCTKMTSDAHKLSCRISVWDQFFNDFSIEGLYGEAEVKYVPACNFLNKQ